MALQVWLPLNGNTDNLGLFGNLAFTQTSTVVDSANGKIGACKEFTGGYLNAPFDFTLGNAASYSAWVYYNSRPSSSSNDWVFQAGTSSGYANTVLGFVTYTNRISVCIGGVYADYTYTLATGVWYHLAVTWDGSIANFYINGDKVASYTTLNSGTKKTATNLSLGANVVGSNTRIQGRINDLRIYDHCLSDKEVKELSQALIVHYKLEANSSTPNSYINLVANGWGGTDNWAYKTTGVYTDVPANTSITNSYGESNYTLEYIPIIQDHTYQASAYVKKASGTSGYYIAWIPYDVDYNRIYAYQSIGFSSTKRTTLAQDLNPGDTTVYLTNVSNWTSFGTNESVLAFFGYADSTGYVYPDYTYTRNCYSFNKTSVDTTNNTINLTNAYSGNTIKAGTAVCTSSYGATYYYSANGTAPADWTNISTSFTPKNVTYLKAAKYLRFTCMSTNYNYSAGITLKDTTAGNTVFDVSGYKRNGSLVSTTLSTSINSPRYENCIENADSYPLKAVFNFPESNGLTIACWIYLTAWGSQGSGLWATSSNSTSSPNDYTTTTCNHYDSTFSCRGTNGTTYNISTSNTGITTNAWNHIVLTHDGANLKIYVNGVFAKTAAAPSPLVGFKSLFLGYSYAGGLTRQCKGKWSDFRMYATALSEADILDLYKISASIDNLGSLYCFDAIEKESNLWRHEFLQANATTNIPWTTRNGDKAFKITPSQFYNGSFIPMLKNKFLPNTQYKFDLWIDADDVVASSAPTQRYAGVKIRYTDGVYESVIVVGNSENPIGWQEKVFFSNASKSIDYLIIYYDINIGGYYRWDSTITKVGMNASIEKNGDANAAQFKENSNIAKIYKAGDIKENHLNEK